MIIAKFGGSSVACKDSAKKIKNIVEQNGNIKFVVVSAIGKSEKYTQKVTDLLYKLYHLYKTDEDYIQILEEIINRYSTLAKELNININLSKEKQKIINRLISKNASKDYIVSRGEYLSAIIYSKYLQGQFLDASDYIIFKSNNEINFHQTRKRLTSLTKDKTYIIGGFYGASSNGKIKTFSRGGSDISGAVIAKVLNAEVYENYTDVDGVFDKNPRVFSNAKQLPILSYKTAYGMADAGNEIVHKTALKVLKGTKTVLIVKNTISGAFGTVVTSADYILDNLFVCQMKVTVLKFAHLYQNDLKEVYSIGLVKQVIKIDIFYYVLFEEIYISKSKVHQLNGLLEVFDGVKFTLFNNVKIKDKNIKKLQKIVKKLKKCLIFGDFLSYKNNFCLLVKKENNHKVLSIINKYLQQ